MHIKMVGGDSAGTVTAFYVSKDCIFVHFLGKETIFSMRLSLYRDGKVLFTPDLPCNLFAFVCVLIILVVSLKK